MVNILDLEDKDGNIVQINQMDLSTERGRESVAERLKITREELNKRFNLPYRDGKN
jgi:hypothetical protein